MADQTLGRYKSRRNRVELIRTDVGRVVVKAFLEEDDFQKELRIYRLLQDTQLPCAKVISAQDKTLVLSELPGQTLVDCLEQQERTDAPTWGVWEKLVDWLIAFQRQTGLVMTDVNLRNFLYDGKTSILYGVDFEECDEGSMERCAGSVAAYIRTYDPGHTRLKQKISQYILELFARKCGLECDILVRETGQQEQRILERRKK